MEKVDPKRMSALRDRQFKLIVEDAPNVTRRPRWSAATTARPSAGGSIKNSHSTLRYALPGSSATSSATQ